MKEKVVKYIVTVIAFLGCILFNTPAVMKEYVIPCGIFLCQFIIVVVAYTGFIMLLTNITCKENNKINVLAYSYFVLSFILILNIYLFVVAFKGPPMPNVYYTNYLMIEILESVMLYVALNIVNERQNIKFWMVSIAILGIVGIGVAVEKERVMLNIITNQYKLIYYILIATFMFIGLKNSKKEVYGKEVGYFNSAIILKIIYLIGNISNRMLLNGLWTLIFSIINTLHYVYIYEFIYKITMKQVWYPAGENLNSKQSELEQEELERYNLVFASYALKKHVNIIDHETILLKKKMEKSCGEKSLQHIEKIKNNCRRLMKLSNNILDLGQMDMGNVTPKYKPTNMNQLIEVLVESILPYVESRGLQIEIKQTQKSVYCYVDADEIERVLLNLISNAIKYSKPNGKICVYVNERQERAYICVEDTGIGIPEEKLKNIFGRFERVETGFSRKQEGSGLGLAIVKSIIEMHQGEIQVHSKEGQGTLVSFNLPIYEGQKSKQVDIRSKTTLKRKIEVEFADLRR